VKMPIIFAGFAGYIHPPNVAGATVLSLGCQNSQIEILHEQIARRNPHFSMPMFVFEQTGTPIAPVLKISTNSPLAQRMQDIIDIDTGAVISGGSTIEEMGDAWLDRLVEVASGQLRTKAELRGPDDFIPWKRGVSL